MRFALATHAHDAQLRGMAATEAMPGRVRLAFAREPSFLDGVSVQGHDNQVVVLLDGDTVMGAGCRSVRRVFMDGVPTDFGYLSGLRSKPHVRLHTLLARGYRFLRELHRDGRVVGYLTTIVEDNRYAMALLTSGRAGLPLYLPRGRCHTYAIPLRRRARQPSTGPLHIQSGATVGAEIITAFLAEHGAARQYFPVVHATDFGTPTLRGLTPADFRVATHNGTVMGVAAVWDQRAFRQTLVAGYAPALRAARPALNAALRIAGYSKLPSPGSPLNLAYLAFLCVRDNAPDVFAQLLETTRFELADSDLSFLCVGLHERDPLNAVLARVRHQRYDSRLFTVCWEDTRAQCEAFAAHRVPHVEIATL
jgi:hypothetical protein